MTSSTVPLAGWSRYSHKLPLCELLPSGLPTLVAQLLYIREWSARQPQYDPSLVEVSYKYHSFNSAPLKLLLGCINADENMRPIVFGDATFTPPPEWRFLNCSRLPGLDVYRAVESLRLGAWKAAITRNTSEISSLRPSVSGDYYLDMSSRVVSSYKQRSHLTCMMTQSTSGYDKMSTV